MPKKLTLTKATRRYACKAFHLLPHQVLGAELVSLRNRLEDATEKRSELLQVIEATQDRQEFNHLLKKELPKIERLIERLNNELKLTNDEYTKELQDHLDQVNAKHRPRPQAD